MTIIIPSGTRNETAFLARISTEAPRIPWDVFITEIFKWRQGEHCALIGPTGQGKTTLMLNIMPLHPYTVAFATKPADETMDALLRAGWLRMQYWPSGFWGGLDPDKYPRRVLWPDATQLGSEPKQQAVFQDAFAKIYREGGWTVGVDEQWFLETVLRLKRTVQTFLLQTRALKISMVLNSQRPAWISVETFSSATHLFLWRNNDETDLRRLGGIGWLSADLIRSLVASLEMHQYLYINTRTGYMCRSKCPEAAITKIQAVPEPRFSFAQMLGRR
jgi:energy-coupling factor transporter ATP-binding protein EcfA2